MKEYALFIKRMGLVSLANLFVNLSAVILLPIITKNLSIQDYGIWVQVNITILLVPYIASLGLSNSMIRFLAVLKEKNEIREGFYSIMVLTIISTFIISLFFYLFSNYLAILFNGNIQIAKIIPFIIFITTLNFIIINFFRTVQKMKIYSFFLLVQAYINVILVYYFVIAGYGIYGAVLGILITQIIVFILMYSSILSSIGIKIPRFKNLKKYLLFGVPLIPSSLSSWIVDSSDRYIIGLLLGTTFVGYYSPGYILGNIITIFSVPFTIILFPTLSKKYDENQKKETKFILNYSLKYFLLIAIPSFFGLSILSKPILLLLSTPEIATNGNIVTPFIALSAIFFGIYAIVSQIILIKEKTKIIAYSWFLVAALNIILNLIVILYWGFIGAAVVTLISYFIIFVITWVYSRKYFKLDLNIIFIIKCTFASALMSLLILKFYPVGILEVLLFIVIFAVGYILILLVSRAIKKQELMFFKNILK
ncbi:MAG: oligosaccharide flippase family protein [Methanobacteriaceae archaeon]|nr:oligosaccharide flippase family protein [Methanobacteriaceae archaeon]